MTSDGGTSWLSQSSGTSLSLFSVSFIDANTAMVVGDSGIILRTTDGGTAWISQSGGTALSLFGVNFFDQQNGYSVGEDGIILRTTNGGVTFIETGEIPEYFFLSQNYPNPFNPTTTIRYQLTEREFVSLKVYDILRREVAELVNEEKPAGSYEVEFNSHSGNVRNLTSGIYFYQIKAGDYSETKKMILLK